MTFQQLHYKPGARGLPSRRHSRVPHCFKAPACSVEAQQQHPAQPAASSPQNQQAAASRRDALLALISLSAASSLAVSRPALAFTPPPPGFRAQIDKLDGYSFFYPEVWTAVTSSGNDVFLRNPFNIDENLFVDITSPSSSRYTSPADLGTPTEAAQKLLDRYLTKEFMSTRLGIKREGQIVSAVERVAPDGKLYFDLTIRMKSFASRNPYVATQAEVYQSFGLEWDRTLTTVLGVANKRLYELRIQTASDTYEKSLPQLKAIAESFRVVEVEA